MYQLPVAMKKNPSHTRDIPKWRVFPYSGYPHREGVPTRRKFPLG